MYTWLGTFNPFSSIYTNLLKKSRIRKQKIRKKKSRIRGLILFFCQILRKSDSECGPKIGQIAIVNKNVMYYLNVPQPDGTSFCLSPQKVKNNQILEEEYRMLLSSPEIYFIDMWNMGTNLKLEMTFNASHSDQTYFHSYFYNISLMAKAKYIHIIYYGYMGCFVFFPHISHENKNNHFLFKNPWSFSKNRKPYIRYYYIVKKKKLV